MADKTAAERQKKKAKPSIFAQAKKGLEDLLKAFKEKNPTANIKRAQATADKRTRRNK